MKVADLKKIVNREPFRPFAVRLNNGVRYNFTTPKDLGAAKDGRMIFYFADSGGAVRIDSDSVVEIIETN